MPWLTGGRLDLVRRDERTGGVATRHTDAAVIYGAPGGNTRLRTVELGTEDRVAAVGPRHPLARRRRPHWAELAGHALVVNKLSGTVGPALWPPGARPAVARSGCPTAPAPLPPQRQTRGGAAPAGPGPGSGRTSWPAAAANSATALCAGSDMPPGPQPLACWSSGGEAATGLGVRPPNRTRSQVSSRVLGGTPAGLRGATGPGPPGISRRWRSLARPCGGDAVHARAALARAQADHGVSGRCHARVPADRTARCPRRVLPHHGQHAREVGEDDGGFSAARPASADPAGSPTGACAASYSHALPNDPGYGGWSGRSAAGAGESGGGGGGRPRRCGGRHRNPPGTTHCPRRPTVWAAEAPFAERLRAVASAEGLSRERATPLHPSRVRVHAVCSPPRRVRAQGHRHAPRQAGGRSERPETCCPFQW
ncbi:LysR family transcriptional regulator substrate-binding protein [Streptomyces sp. NPDC001056]